MRETAYAKLNLALHVRGRAADGYHRIETVFAFCEEGDLLAVSEGEGLSLAVSGPFAAEVPGGEDNLVLRAARSLAEACAVPAGAAIALDKRLPAASGIGGGSADAAAALRLLARFWSLDDAPLAGIAAALGADVAACLASRPARGEGRGDALAPFDPGLAGTPVLLANPGVPLATAAVFAGWDGVDRGRLDDWRRGRNDLEPPARRLAPEIGEVLAALAGSRLARMSGSGATCFALYDNDEERDLAAERIATAHPNWWILATRIRG